MKRIHQPRRGLTSAALLCAALCLSCAAVFLFAALCLTLPGTALAQGSGMREDAGPGDCTASAQPHECAERCPSFDTCITRAESSQLYYRVGDERFDCDGLDCGEASQQLGDYCCARGEFAPKQGGGGGCALGAAPPPAPGVWLALGGVVFAALRRRRSVA